MSRKRISGHQTMCVSILDQRLHRVSRVIVEGERRSHDPDDLSMFFLITQEIHQAVIVSRIGGLSAPALAKHKLIRKCCLFLCLKSGAVDINALFTAFTPSQDHLISFFEIPVFNHFQMSIRTDHYAGIHAAFFRQNPFPLDLKIFREHGCAVKIFRSYPIHLHNFPSCVRSLQKPFL